MGFERFLSSMIRDGSLTVRIGGQTPFTVGAGEPHLRVFLKDYATAAKIASNPAMALGEGFMDGRVVVENGTIYDLLDLAGRNLKYRKSVRLGPVRRTLSDLFQQWNARAQARRNVAHHYDLSGELYRRFLDADMQYSCAYFTDPDMSLDEAQVAK